MPSNFCCFIGRNTIQELPGKEWPRGTRGLSCLCGVGAHPMAHDHPNSSLPARRQVPNPSSHRLHGPPFWVRSIVCSNPAPLLTLQWTSGARSLRTACLRLPCQWGYWVESTVERHSCRICQVDEKQKPSFVLSMASKWQL